jgi:hypothetical protein
MHCPNRRPKRLPIGLQPLGLLWGLTAWMLVAATGELHAQNRHRYLIKVDPLGAAFGEFRISLEKKIRRTQYFYSSAGFYSHSQNLEGDPGGEVSNFNQLFRSFFTSDYNKFVYSSAGFYYRDYYNRGFVEKLRGPLLRFGIRQYVLSPQAPHGTFFYLGMHYAFIRGTYHNERMERLNEVFMHRTGLTAAVGHQRLYGLKQNFAIDGFAGLEYSYYVRERDIGTDNRWQKMPRLVAYFGLQVGFAFKKKNAHY